MKTKSLLITMLCAVAMTMNAQEPAKTYDFANLTDAQKAELAAGVDNGFWKMDNGIYKSGVRIGKNKKPVDYTNIAKLGGEPLRKAEKEELSFAKGLLFAVYLDTSKECKGIYPSEDTNLGNIWFNVDNAQEFKNALQLNATNVAIIIPGLKKGMKVSVRYRSTTSNQNRYLNGFNFEDGHTFVAPTDAEPGKTDHTGEGTVAADGAAWVTSTAGIFVYDITVKDVSGNVLSIDELNVLTGIDEITAKTMKADSKVYDLNGRYMGNGLNALQRGIYIVNGRKVVK